MEKSIFQITKSKTRIAILELFFNDPEQEYYLRQIEKLTGYSVGNIRREIIAFEKGGLFLHRMLGKVKLYRLNKTYPIYSELKNIVRKTISIEGRLKNIIQAHNDIMFAFLYGSFAKGEESSMSDVDIIIIGEMPPKTIKSELFRYQSQIGREINSTVYTKQEFLDKLKNKNHFISTVVKEPKIFLKGTEDEFRRFIQIRKAKKT
jgi:predicted nucleotidyltransferase